MAHNLKQIELLFPPFLESFNEVVNYQIKSVFSGKESENTVYSISLKVKDLDSKKEKTLNIIAKTFPNLKTEKGLLLYNAEKAFTKEIGIYSQILTAIQEFHEEIGKTNGFDMIPDYYGSRLSLKFNAIKPDEDAVILLENLTSSGFKTNDKSSGFNLEVTKVVLADLAAFHAIPIAYKLLKPQKFKQVFLPHLVTNVNEAIFKFNPNEEEKLRQQIVKAAMEGVPKCSLLSSKILQALEAAQNHIKNPPPINETFATINHNNLWLNNILVKYERTRPIKSKFVDFKVTVYDSLAKDLVFFLFSSVQKSVLDGHFDELIRYYHNNFIKTLERYGCDNSLLYDLKNLYDEIGTVIRTSELLHLSFILKIVYSDRGALRNDNNFELDKIAHEEGGQDYKRRLAETIIFFNEREWL